MAGRSKLHEIQQQHGKPIQQIISDLYEKLGNQTAVARELGISQSTLSVWLVKLGMEEKTVVIEKEAAQAAKIAVS